jgi:hypothetical protein
MSATITLTGPEGKLKQVLNFWEEINKEAPDFGVDEFARGLTKDGRRVVSAICQSSVRGEHFYQDQLFDLLGLGGENEVWGVMGGIGRHWAKTISQPNPFIRKWDTTRSRGYYQIDSNLAAELIEALKAVDNAGQLLVYIQGETGSSSDESIRLP